MKALLMFVAMTGSLAAVGVSADNVPSLEWIAVYAGSTGGEGFPRDFVVGGSGAVYVTGMSEKQREPSEPFAHGGPYSEMATVKFDESGKQIWAKRYSMFEDTADGGSGIAVDEGGNVYVTGNSNRPRGADCICVTFKYDANGKQLWMSTHDGGSTSAVGVDRQGCAYVCGRGARGYQTIRYDTHGVELWVQEFSKGFNRKPWFWDMTIDSCDNVYVAGNGGIVKYMPNGEQVWAIECEAEKVSGDNEGSVSIIGLVHQFGRAPFYATTKYSNRGKEVWSRRFTVSGGKAGSLTKIGIDGTGAVFVGGLYRVKDEVTDVIVTKYDAGGRQEWQQLYQKELDGGRNLLVDLAVNQDGEVYVLINSDRRKGLIDTRDLVLTKYDGLGRVQWEKRERWKYGTLEKMRIDDKDNIYVMGQGGEYGEFVIAKYQQPKIKVSSEE